MTKIAFLENPILEYAWGSKTFIPELLGNSNPDKKPKAELWMGAHSKAPSFVILDGERISLLELIQKNPVEILGESVAKRFSNQLPFLFKVLAASSPLSIQAHPDKEQAHKGFLRENRHGIPLDDPERNYKDENHKPELICALTPLWGLKGFRPLEEIQTLTKRIASPALNELVAHLKSDPIDKGFKTFFVDLMAMAKERLAEIVKDTVLRCKKLIYADPAFKWVVKLDRVYPGDVGVLSPIILNLVRLEPGDSMAMPSGQFHAYLDGAGIEIMANSDNVLRGGLTPKHIDVKELVNILDFQPKCVQLIRSEMKDEGVSLYPNAVDEFMLSVLSPKEDLVINSTDRAGVEIMICVEGNAEISDSPTGDTLLIHKGASVIIPACVEQYQITGNAKIYRASVPNP